MKNPPRISLGDVALKAGVSRMTVSLALREDGRIPEETRLRVRDAARLLGYRPNATLSRIMAETARTRHGDCGSTLAFLTTEPTGRDFAGDEETFSAASLRAADYGYAVEHFWISDPKISAAHFNRILWTRGVQGVIIPNLSHALYARGQRTLPIEWEKFCIVEISDTMLEPVVNRVRHNHFGAMIKALDELEALGYRRIGLCLSTEVDLRTHHRWCAAFLLWRAMRPGVRTITPLLFGEIVPKQVAQWVRKHRLDAVLSPGGDVLRALRRSGLQVPADLGFATLDAWGLGAEAVSGIDQERRVLAGFAVDMLVTLIHRQSCGIPEHPLEWLFTGTWVAGQTTAAHPGAAPTLPLDSEPLSF